jgi:hypothetical protein
MVRVHRRVPTYVEVMRSINNIEPVTKGNISVSNFSHTSIPLAVTKQQH